MMFKFEANIARFNPKIMKRTVLPIFILQSLILLGLTSCNEIFQRPVMPKVDRTELTFGVFGGSETVFVEGDVINSYWVEEPLWCRSDYDVYGASCTFEAMANLTDDVREAVYRFEFEGKTIDVTLTQEANPDMVYLEPMDIVFPPSGGTQKVKIYFPDEYYDYWGMDDNGNTWVWATGESYSTEDGVVEIIGTYPNALADFNGTVEFCVHNFQDDNQKWISVNVSQAMDSSLISVDPLSFDLPIGGGEQLIVHLRYPANCELDAVGSDWYDMSLWSWDYDDSGLFKEQELHLDVPANYTGQDRSCPIRLTFSCNGYERIIEVPVYQEGDNSPIIEFEDERFLEAILRMDYGWDASPDWNEDGMISEKEASRLRIMYVEGEEGSRIRSMKEISYFTSLEELYCDNNSLLELDLSQNKALKRLDCSSNLLTSLDLSANTALERLECRSNGLVSIDVKECTSLKYLDFKENEIQNIDLGANSSLELLYCSQNSLTELNLSACQALQTLYCDRNSMTSLTLNSPALTTVDCSYSEIRELIVEGCAALKELDCSGTKIAVLDLTESPLLSRLLLPGSYGDLTLESLDISGNQAMENLNCSLQDNLHTVIARNTRLLTLNCGSGAVSTLDVTGSADLRTLKCNGNKLAELDVTSCGYLQTLNCGSNEIRTLDLSLNTMLKSLEVKDNPLETVRLSGSNSYASELEQYLRSLFPDIHIEY